MKKLWYTISDWFLDLYYKIRYLEWNELPSRIKNFYFNNGIFGISMLAISIMVPLSLISGVVIVHNDKVAHQVEKHNQKVAEHTYAAVNEYRGKAVNYLAFYTDASKSDIRHFLKMNNYDEQELDAKTKNAKTDQQFWKILNPIGDKYLSDQTNEDLARAQDASGLKFVMINEKKWALTDIDWKKPIMFVQVDPNEEKDVNIVKEWVKAGKKDGFEIRVYNKQMPQSYQGFTEGLFHDIIPGNQANMGKSGYGHDLGNLPTTKDAVYFLKDGNLYGGVYKNIGDLPKDIKFPTNNIRK